MTPYNDIFFQDTISTTVIESFGKLSSNFSHWPKLTDMLYLSNFFGLGFINPNTKEYLNLEQFKYQYGLKFYDTRYEYRGSKPMSKGKLLVEEDFTPVIALKKSQLLSLSIDVKLRWITLLNSTCSDKISSSIPNDYFLITSGSILTTSDGKEWCFVNGEPYYTPFARIMDLLYQTLHMAHPKGPLDQKGFAKLLPIEQICESICNSHGVDSNQVLLWGIANDLGGSKQAPKDLISEIGSQLVDTLAIFTQNPVLAGGDGTEAYIWTNLFKAKELIKAIAYNDFEKVDKTPLTVRTSFFFFNFMTFGELMHEKGFRLSFETISKLAEQISIQYSAILQSTVKAITSDDVKATTVFSGKTAEMFGIQAKQFNLSGTTPNTKFQPNIYTWDEKSSKVGLKRHKVSVTPIRSEEIHVHLI